MQKKTECKEIESIHDHLGDDHAVSINTRKNMYIYISIIESRSSSNSSKIGEPWWN